MVSRVSLDLVIHPATEPENQVESALLLDVVVRKGPPVLKLLSSEDEPLLVWGNSLLVLRTEMLEIERRSDGRILPGFWPLRSQ